MNSKLKTSMALLVVLVLVACQSGSDEAYHNQASKTFTSPVTQSKGVSSDLDQSAEDIASLIEDDGSTKRLSVLHHKVECEGHHVQHCFLTRSGDSDEWVFFYDHIEGFEYQWGVNYEILVKVEEVETLMADMSNQRYTLLAVISERPQSDDNYFQYTARQMHDRIIEVAPGYFSLLGLKAFTCTEDVCASVLSAISQQHSAVLSFQHREDAGKPLKLISVVCSDARSSFSASCL